MKRAIHLAKVAIVLLTAIAVSACRYNATDADRAAVEGIISTFANSIETYSVSSMTGNMTDSFVLTLKEGSLDYSKTLSTLREELESEETNQLDWRSAYGYRLELGLTGGVPSFNDRFAAAQRGFSVIESADGIAPITTDTGTIDWQFVKMGECWRIAAMTITFDTATGSTAAVTPGSLPGSPFFRGSSR